MSYGGLPPHLTNPMALEAQVKAGAERAQKRGLAGMPTFALIFILPFVGVYLGSRFIYRKITRYSPPPEPEPERISRSEMRSMMNDICSGSGTAVGDNEMTAACKTCGKEIRANSGKLLTHSW